MILAGVGIYLSYVTGVNLAKIEEQNRNFDKVVRGVLDRLVAAQVDVLIHLVTTLHPQTATGATGDQGALEDAVEQLKRFKREVLDQTEEAD